MQLIDAKKACKMLNIRLPRLYELVRLGAIPCVSMGSRQVRFDVGVLEEWVRGGGMRVSKAESGSGRTGQ